MIEINPKIIDPKHLEERVLNQMKRKNILVQMENMDVLSLIYKDIRSARDHFLKMNLVWQLKELPIQSHRRYIGKIIVFSKRAFRKLTRWLFSTYYNQQNEFNAVALSAIGDLIRVQENLIKKLEGCNEN